MDHPPQPPVVDLDDFDGVGVLSEVVVSARSHVMTTGSEVAVVVGAPTGWHRMVINAKAGGSSVLVVRFDDLTVSRTRNVASALERRGWQADEDHGGATLRMPPGTSAMDVAFEVAAALTVAGAPADPRELSATDGTGASVDLSPT